MGDSWWAVLGERFYMGGFRWVVLGGRFLVGDAFVCCFIWCVFFGLFFLVGFCWATVLYGRFCMSGF